MMWLETVINGVLYGGLYGLLGVGLALIVGVMRVVNLSHGEFIVLSAFIGVSLVGRLPLAASAGAPAAGRAHRLRPRLRPAGGPRSTAS